MINQQEINFFNSNSKSSTYINRDKKDCNWSFSKKNINNSNNIFSIVTIFVFTISIIAYII